MTNIKKLNSNSLKLIAIIAMTVDHIAWAVFPGYSHEPVAIVLHIIGRITCPVMCFFIAEGYYYTRNINKYTLRLFVLAFISHFAYIFASGAFDGVKSFIPFYFGSFFNQTSVVWSLAWGLVLLRLNYTDKIKKTWLKMILTALICFISFPSDWSCIAALCVYAIGINKGDFKKQTQYMLLFVFSYSLIYACTFDLIYGILQMGVVLSVPLLSLYDGKRGGSPKINKFMKWFFYVYYPLHLVIIGSIKYF